MSILAAFGTSSKRLADVDWKGLELEVGEGWKPSSEFTALFNLHPQ